MTKVLEFGPQEEALSESFFVNPDVTIKPMEGAWWEIDGKFDAIFSYYNFTSVPFPIEQEVLTNWASHLNKEGTLYIIVPSWEYMSRVALQEQIAHWLKPMMFNSVNQFTMRGLRIMFNKAGLKVTSAKTGVGRLQLAGNELELEQHYVVGQRP